MKHCVSIRFIFYKVIFDAYFLILSKNSIVTFPLWRWFRFLLRWFDSFILDNYFIAVRVYTKENGIYCNKSSVDGL